MQSKVESWSRARKPPKVAAAEAASASESLRSPREQGARDARIDAHVASLQRLIRALRSKKEKTVTGALAKADRLFPSPPRHGLVLATNEPREAFGRNTQPRLGARTDSTFSATRSSCCPTKSKPRSPLHEPTSSRIFPTSERRSKTTSARPRPSSSLGAYRKGGFGSAIRWLNAHAPPVPPSATPIEAAWRPIGVETLAQTPAPRRWLLSHPTKNWMPCREGEGDGLLPLGKAGVLSAEGGAGKAQALLQLGMAVITGRPWLDHFAIGETARGRGALLAIAEEDVEELARRSFDAVRAMNLSEADIALVACKLVVLPLAGVPVALLRRDSTGCLSETDELRALRRRS